MQHRCICVLVGTPLFPLFNLLLIRRYDNREGEPCTYVRHVQTYNRTDIVRRALIAFCQASVCSTMLLLSCVEVAVSSLVFREWMTQARLQQDTANVHTSPYDARRQTVWCRCLVQYTLKMLLPPERGGMRILQKKY